MADSDNRLYEALFLFGTAATANLDGTLQRVRTIVEGAGGSPVVLKKFDERRLAYEIKKQKRGLYILCFYEGPSTSVSAIDREVRLTDDVLRHIIISAEHLTQAEMEAMEPQKYEPIELDPDRRPRRPAPAEGEGDAEKPEGEGADDASAERADAETAAAASD